jgi:hypothetical protein
MQTLKPRSLDVSLSPGLQDSKAFCTFLSGLNERQRRQCVALEAQRLGYGGIAQMSRLTGMHPNTIIRGKREIKAGPATDLGIRVRCPGAGRPLAEVKYPQIEKELAKLVEPKTAGDPCSKKKWVRCSLTELACQLTTKGYQIGRDTIGRLLKKATSPCARVASVSRGRHTQIATSSLSISKRKRRNTSSKDIPLLAPTPRRRN